MWKEHGILISSPGKRCDMEILKFRLRGKNAFFKVPEVNTYYYFTYGNIHKVALLGMFGAIMGYQGYEHKYDRYPEFYEKLKDIQISVIPEGEHGYFQKKIQFYNNTVGYASQEMGGNLIVKEQWLEHPDWTVCVLIQDPESKKLADFMVNRRCVYTPYLGRNNHLADIDEVEIIEAQMIECEEKKLHSLVPADVVEFDMDEMSFKYGEYLPTGLKEVTNLYEVKKFILTDAEIVQCEKDVYQIGDRNIVFY